jgi:hypothetical protein
MNLENQKRTGYLILGLALMVISSRLIPHAPNFTATMAAVIFSSLVIRNWTALIGILIAYFLSDLIVNNLMYRQNEFLWFSPGLIWIYIPFIVVFAVNRFFIKKETAPLTIFSNSLFASIVFFLVSNFGVWINSKITYTHDLSGLLICYINAIPFLAYEIAGTLFYSSVLFSVYWLYFYKYKVNEYKG